MNIKEAISKIQEFDEFDTVYAFKINGQFIPSSEVTIVNHSDEEEKWTTSQISEKYCKGKQYFLEVFIIKELIGDFSSLKNSNINAIVERIIHYAENDA